MRIQLFYVWFMAIWLFIWIPCRFFTPLYFSIRHTYQLPAAACLNELTDDWWTFESVREGLFVLYILVPFSICFMMWTRERVAWGFHIFLSVLFLCWSIVMLGFDASDVAAANVPPGDVNFRPENLARDPRWCLYYGGQPNTNLICANSGPCMGPAVDPASFTVYWIFLIRFIMNILLLGMLVVDLWTVWGWKNMILEKKQATSTVKGRVRYSTLK